MKILILQELNGCFEVVTDGPAEVICVCEQTPNDRLYRMTSAHDVNAERVAEILRGDPIGSQDDDRHKSLVNRITSGMTGRRPFKIVETE